MSDVVTTGADPAVAVQPNGNPPPANGSDLESRIKSDGAYAWEQYNKVKGEGTKTFQALQKMKPIHAWVEQYGAEKLAEWIGEYDAVLKDPTVKRVADHYRTTRTLPPANADQKTDFDELFQDPQAQKLASLETQLATLSNAVSQTQGAVGKQRVTEMLTRLKTENPDGFDDYVLPALRESFDNWEKSHDGRQLLANIQYDQLKAVAGRAMFDNADKIYELRHARKLDELKRGATGAPASNLSTGREPAPTAKKPGHMSAVEALKEFERTTGERLGR